MMTVKLSKEEQEWEYSLFYSTLTLKLRTQQINKFAKLARVSMTINIQKLTPKENDL